MTPRLLLPNLGAEEGSDWRAIQAAAPAQRAARLWSLLLRADDLRVRPTRDGDFERIPVGQDWPAALGEPADRAAFPWLETETDAAIPWLVTETLATESRTQWGVALAGPPPAITSACSDKAFAAESAGELGLEPRALRGLVEIVSAEACRAPDTLMPRLAAALETWPAWTRQRFTVKPRQGTSGRGRIAGVGAIETEALRGALPRLAERGGAIFEPWLDRAVDLSVALHLPTAESGQPPPGPSLVGSLEVLNTPAGVYRGHAGEVDNRGRVFSGHGDDEALRGDAAMLAARARERGFFGPCGVDAFTFRTEPETPGEDGRLPLRSAVEFNARMTMGHVAIGLIRRALPVVRAELDLFPGSRRGFLFLPGGVPSETARAHLAEHAGPDVRILELGSAADTPPLLCFGPDLESLREADRRAADC